MELRILFRKLPCVFTIHVLSSSDELLEHLYQNIYYIIYLKHFKALLALLYKQHIFIVKALKNIYIHKKENNDFLLPIYMSWCSKRSQSMFSKYERRQYKELEVHISPGWAVGA